MSGENGRSGDTAKPMKTVIPLDSGVTIWVSPVSQETMALLDKRAVDKYPPPDPAPYEKVIEDSAIPGQKYAAEMNPEYQALMQEVFKQRATWKLRALRDLAVEFPEDTREELMERFRPKIAQMVMLDLMDEPASEDALWDAIWSHCLLLSPDNQLELVMIARSQMPITQEETAEAVRLFRPNLSRQGLRGLVIRSQRATDTPGTEGKPDAGNG